MNHTHRTTWIASVTVAVAALAAGCASVAVTEDKLEENTATALGLARGAFTISERSDSGLTTNYAVKTKSGQQYNCYVTGTVSVVGRVVSDAICNKKGAPARNPLTGR